MNRDHDDLEEGPRGRRSGAPRLSPQEARQGRIVLDTKAKRWIFFGGLLAFVAAVFVFAAW